MKFANKSISVVLTGCSFLLAATAFAENCTNYPYSDGIDPEQIANNKYVSTASAGVSFDDIDALNDSREEAEIEAKARLVKFLEEDIQSDSTISKLVNESKKMSGSGKENLRTEAITRTKSLRNSAQGLMRGIIKIGECYTKGKEVRVTVGFKQETLDAAEKMAGSIGTSLSKQATPTKGNTQSSKQGSNSSAAPSTSVGAKQPLNGVDEYSNSSKLDKF